MKLRGASTTGELNGFLDAGSHMKGELHFEDTFRIDGKLTGSVISDGDLIVGIGGELEGEVHVSRLFISGTIRGSIQVTRRVEITAQGRVFADIDTPSLVIEDGAMFEGQCAMSDSAKVGKGEPETALGPKPIPLKKDR
jgi:cytoskeletal protein CcmA (bactofilin family)